MTGQEQREEQDHRASERAWRLGQEYGRRTPLDSIGDTEEMYQAARRLGCPMRFFDVFKYGAQDSWRLAGL
jgi:hypothetical protein